MGGLHEKQILPFLLMVCNYLPMHDKNFYLRDSRKLQPP